MPSKKRNTAEPDHNPRKTGIKDNSHKSGKQAQARDQRRLEALARQEAYNSLSNEQKIARAVATPGASARELKRLRSQGAKV
jgi:hypothetical protein